MAYKIVVCLTISGILDLIKYDSCIYHCLGLTSTVISISVDLVSCLVDLEHLSSFGPGLPIYLKRCVSQFCHWCFPAHWISFVILKSFCGIGE